MAWECENNAAQTVDLGVLRLMVADRLQDAQRRFDPASASAAFAAANNDNDNLVGSLLFGMLCWAPFMASFNLGAAGAVVQSPLAAAVADGISLVWDEKVMKNRRLRRSFNALKDGLYHGGRRQNAQAAKKEMAARFNLVAANENAQYAYDTGAEIAGMAQMLENIDALERARVTEIALKPAQAISTGLDAAVRQLSRRDFRSQPVGMRKAV